MGKKARRTGRPKGLPRTPAEKAADALRTGRPKSDKPGRTERVTTNFSAEEMERMKAAAAAVGQSHSGFMRNCVLHVLHRNVKPKNFD